MRENNESKWREFEISFGRVREKYKGISNSSEMTERAVFDVIEIGALDELRTQLASAKEDVEYWKNSYKQMTIHYSNQTEKLRVAIDVVRAASRHLFKSNDPTVIPLAYKTPAQALIEQAKYLEQKDADITFIRNFLAKLEDGNE